MIHPTSMKPRLASREIVTKPESRSRVLLVAVFVGMLLGPAGGAEERYPNLAEFRLPASQTLPEVESAQQVIFTDTVSGIPAAEGIDRITAPPIAVVLGQRLELRDAPTGESCFDSEPELVWEPGAGTVSRAGRDISWTVRQTALFEAQGFLLSIEIRNHSANRRSLVFASTQQPSLTRPEHWNWDPTFRRDFPAIAIADGSLVAHQNLAGAVVVALAGGTALPFAEASTLERRFEIAANSTVTIHLAIVVAADASSAAGAARRLLKDPLQATRASRERMERNIEAWFQQVPVLRHPDPRVVRFYRHAAVQLLWARWKLGDALALDPWYSTSGRDSGALNAYAWDLQYAALPLALLDPTAMRALLVALPAAPLSQHFSIEPLRGAGLGPFYSYNSYAYTAAVDEYLRRTGDWGLLQTSSGGKTILEWLMELAQWGERDRDPDGNGLLDCGNDKNMLELKKTGKGPGYVNEVPSPNGERAWVYETVADYLEHVSPSKYEQRISRFRDQSLRVRRALNDVLWLDEPGWYGARQRDGAVVPVYSIQIFDLLRFPGLVPQERARRLVAHINEAEFLGPWGVRSMSIKDRLFDYNDHDWAGPMSYAGDPPQLVADLFGAGFGREAADALERILWWPDHMAVYPQGIANDDYSFRYPEAQKFGGRISAGRSNVIAGCTGMDAIIRGLFGVEPGRDGTIGFAHNHKSGDGPYSLSYPFRGRSWTVTQSESGLQLTTDEGFELELARPTSSVRVYLDREHIAIHARAREEGDGKLILGMAGLLKTLGVSGPERLAVRVNGVKSPSPNGQRFILDFDGAAMDIDITTTLTVRLGAQGSDSESLTERRVEGCDGGRD